MQATFLIDAAFPSKSMCFENTTDWVSIKVGKLKELFLKAIFSDINEGNL
jgi:hypothetical protein